MKTKGLSLLAAAVFTWSSLLPAFPASELEVCAAEETALECMSFSGSNKNAQDYSASRYDYCADIIRSYLVRTADGWMRVQGQRTPSGGAANEVIVEYYDTEFQLTERRLIEQDLPIFGAFYKASDGSYFLITGANNPDESDSQPVYDIARYDADWNLLGSDALYGANTYIPFDAGSVRCDDDGSWLLIHTCHEMYQTDDGNHHQANVTIQVNMQNCEITDSYTDIMNTRVGYVSHSFNQFVLLDNGHIVTLDHGDAGPRSVVLLYYPDTYTGGKFEPDYFNPCQATDLFHIAAPTDKSDAFAYNYTGVGVGGFARSSTHYLTAVTSVDQTASDISSGKLTRNIYISAVPADDRADSSVKTYPLTGYAEGDASASVPHLVEVGEDLYAVLWSQEDEVNVTFIDGTGKPTTNEPYCFEGSLSDCVPVVDNGALVWYTWNNEKVSFYQVSIEDPTDHTVTDYIGGHQYELKTTADADGKAVIVCTKCHEEKTVQTVTDFTIMGSTKPEATIWMSPCPRTLDANGCMNFSISPQGTYDNADFRIELIDGEEFFTPLNPDSTSTMQSFQPVMQDEEQVTATFRIYPVFNPDCVQEITVTLRHRYEEALTERPTLEKGGAVTYTCTECGHVYEKKLAPLTDLASENAEVTLAEDAITFDHSEHRPAVTVTLTDPETGEETELTEDVDYIAVYSDNVNAGTATITLSAVKDSLFLGGSRTETFTIAEQDIAGAAVTWQKNTAQDPAKVFAPDAVLTDAQGTELTAGEDYTVTFKPGKDNALTAVITGKGNYTGSRTESLTAKRIDLSEFTASFADKDLAKSGTVPYTGKAWEPALTVTDGTHKLTAGTDYQITYANNTAAGKASVTITGIGAYTGTISDRSFTILPLDLSDADVFTAALAETEFTYDGTAHKPAVTVSRIEGDAEIPLDAKDYTVSYEGGTDAGTGIVTVTGKGNYSGELQLEFTVAPLDIASEDITVTPSAESFTFTGSAITPEYSVTFGENGTACRAGTDFTVTYADNLHAGTASAVLTGKGNLTGKRTVKFNIAPKKLAAAELTTAYTRTEYTGEALTPAVKRKDALPWTAKTDYTVKYADNLNAGTATVTVTGTGDYTGTATLSFVIEPIDLSEYGDAVPASDHLVYTGKPLTPGVTVSVGEHTLQASDYSLSYDDHLNAGTAGITVTGKGNYTGTLTCSFEILPADLALLKPELSYTSHAYTGSALKPEVLLPDAAAWEPETDYTVTYQNNTNAGTASVLVEGTGNYTGSAKLSFTITPLDLSKGTASVADEAVLYTGKAIVPDVTVMLGKTELTAEDHAVSCTNNTNAGTADVLIEGKGNYTGSLACSFTILPVSLENAKAKPEAADAFDGTEKCPALLQLTAENGALLTSDDYTLTYKDNIDAGEGSILITGKGNATGTLTVPFTIPAADLADCQAVTAEDATYRGGRPIEVLDAVYFGGNSLTAGEDYQILSPETVTDAGEGTLVLAGVGNFTGELSVPYTVSPASIAELTAVPEQTVWIYDGSEICPEVTIRSDNDDLLQNGEDFTLTYQDNDRPGTGRILITGIGNYTGTLECSFEIEAPVTTTTTTTATTTTTVTTAMTSQSTPLTTEATANSTDSTTVSTETTANSTDSTTVSTEATAISTDPTTVSTEATANSTDSTTASTETTANSTDPTTETTTTPVTTDTSEVSTETTASTAPQQTVTRLLGVGDEMTLLQTTGAEYSSSDPTVAAVDENGVLKALAPGSAEITVTLPDGQAICYTITVSDDPAANVRIGDVNLDGQIDAVDASDLLLAAALIGAGEDPALTEKQKIAADVDKNGEINAVDASIILEHAAAIGAGEVGILSDD